MQFQNLKKKIIQLFLFLFCSLLSKGLIPLERFTATESTAVLIFTGNGHGGRL
jgi:hypothetical protein